MSKKETTFVDVILPLALPNYFTYWVPDEISNAIQVGQRVIVSFGRGGKFYTAVVRRVHNDAPKKYEVKSVEAILDHQPSVNTYQFQLWDWMSDYYVAHPGEVMNAAIPAGLTISSENRIVLQDDYKEYLDTLSEKEASLVEILEDRKELNLKEVANLLEVKHTHQYIKSLTDKKVIAVIEELKEKFKPKISSFITLSEEMQNEDNLRTSLNELGKAPKQLAAVMTYLQIKAEEDNDLVEKVRLQKRADVTSVVINQLVKKNIVEIKQFEIGRLPDYDGELSPSNTLNKEQAVAFKRIKEELDEKEIVLLHGVTSSGKTEVYIKLIEEALSRGEQVLYLLPEIALTTQLITRLKKHFGDQVGVYHSRFNANERVEIWNIVLNGHDQSGEVKFNIILGARSALFLPFSNLGLVIIDEEHENSFKQFDPSPRYNARDAATVLAKIHNAKALLGSATPAVETYWNAQQGRYGLIELFKRHGGVQMPEVLCADVADATKRKKMKGHFSPLLIELMEEAFENKEQIILFQNRRGYAPMLMCETCGHVPHCKNCDVGLTYHKLFNHLNCHYCNYVIPLPKQCDACGSAKVSLKGFGTEQIEEELQLMYPKISVARMDYDSTRSKHAYQNIIFEFQNRSIDVLVGTQMVTKGLDFDNVGVVGILNADNMLQFPDFRAFERSYQLMAQVSGRAGRNKKRGKVLIQTYNPDHEIIRNVIDNNYRKMYDDQLIERRNFHYPPFYRLIQFTLMHRDRYVLDDIIADFHKRMQKYFGDRILGPQIPPVSRVRNFYLRNFLLKIERDKSLKSVKKRISDIINDTQQDPKYRAVRIKIDVDPM